MWGERGRPRRCVAALATAENKTHYSEHGGKGRQAIAEEARMRPIYRGVALKKRKVGSETGKVCEQIYEEKTKHKGKTRSGEKLCRGGRNLCEGGWLARLLVRRSVIGSPSF